MKYILLFVLTLSCSTQRLMLTKSEFARIFIRQDEYKKPEFFTPSEDVMAAYNSKTVSRAPASTKNNMEHLSNRQVYFLSLYGQYKRMGDFLGKKNDKLSCPSFHQVILENDGVQITNEPLQASMNLNAIKGMNKELSLFPVLAVPYSDNKDLYSVLEEKGWEESNKHLVDSITHHYKNTEKDVMEMCDKGVSPGYYIYENIVTYYKNKNKFSGAKDAITAMVKVPVLANMLIIDNLSKGHNEALTKYDKWLLQRSNANWYGEFIKRIHSKREALLASLVKGKSNRTVLSLNR